MKPLNKLLYSLITLSLLMGLYFFGCNPSKEPLPEGIVSVQEITSQREKIVTEYQRKTLKLDKARDSLQNVIDKSQTELKLLRNQVRTLRFSIVQKLDQPPGDDTAQIVSDCTELKTEVRQLLSFTQEQDSACIETIEQLETLVQIKDTLIETCEHRVFQTDSLFTGVLHNQQVLEKQLNAQNKELKKRRRQVNLLSAGLLVLSTATLTLLLIR